MQVSDIWKPLPVEDSLADFLALGCRLPGEVRIISTLLNVNNLRPVKLTRSLIGDGPDFNVEVVEDGMDPSPPTRPMTPWLKHEASSYHDVPLPVIEEKLNVCAKKDKSLLDSLKKRRLLHPLMPNAPRVPFRPFKVYVDDDIIEDSDDECKIS